MGESERYVLVLAGDVPAEHAEDGDSVIAWLREHGRVEEVGAAESLRGAVIA